MIQKTAFKKFTLKIIQTHFSEEEMIFNIYGDEKIDQLLAGKDITINQDVHAANQSGVGIIEILNFLSLMAGTYCAWRNLYKTIENNKSKKESKNELSKIEEQWCEELIRAGLDLQTSKKIAKDFKSEFLKKL